MRNASLKLVVGVCAAVFLAALVAAPAGAQTVANPPGGGSVFGAFGASLVSVLQGFVQSLQQAIASLERQIAGLRGSPAAPSGKSPAAPEDAFANATYRLPVARDGSMATFAMSGGMGRPEGPQGLTACNVANQSTGKILAAAADPQNDRGAAVVYCNYGASRTDVFLVAFANLSSKPAQTDEVDLRAHPDLQSKNLFRVGVQSMSLASDGSLSVTALVVPDSLRDAPGYEQSASVPVVVSYVLDSQGKLAAQSSAPAGWATYDNFGISFRYPAEWGTPWESMNGTWQQVSFTTGSSSSPFDVQIQPISQMPNLANYKNSSVEDVAANGLRGKKLLIKDPTTGQLYGFDAYFPVDSRSFAGFSADLSSVSEDVFDKIIATFAPDRSSSVQNDAVNGLSIYDHNGIRFEYPGGLDTKYAQLQVKTSVQKADPSKMDANGCYPGMAGSGRKIPTSIATINGLKFCVTESGDAGAGQLYTDYSYATFRGGNAYMVDYVVHTSNGCGPYGSGSLDVNAPGNEQYKACLDAMKNYDSIVMAPIKQSIGTFAFVQ